MSTRFLHVRFLSLMALVLFSVGCSQGQDQQSQSPPSTPAEEVVSIAPVPQVKPIRVEPVQLRPDELGYEKDIEAIEKKEKESPSKKGAVVFTGSSSIRMWRTLQDDMMQIPAVNRGFGGSTLRQVNAYAERIIFPLEPSVLVIYCGENDIATTDRSPEETHQDFLELVAWYRSNLPNTSILYISMKPSPARWDWWPQFDEGNELIREACDAEEFLSYLDVGPLMLGEDGQPLPDIFLKDKLHMNAKGYALWSEAVYPLIYEQYVSVVKD